MRVTAGLADVDYSENCKEVFVMWSDAGKSVSSPSEDGIHFPDCKTVSLMSSVVPSFARLPLQETALSCSLQCTASIIKHCTVLCTAEEDWNKDFPSIEDIAVADHIFDRAFDSRKLWNLDVVMKQFGDHVTGTGRQIRVAGEANRGTKTQTLGSCKKATASGIHFEQQPIPLAMRAASYLPLQSLSREQSKGPTGLGFPSQNHSKYQVDRHKSVEGRSNHLNAIKDGMSSQAAHPSIKKTCVRPVMEGGFRNLQKRQRVDNSDASLSQRRKENLVESELPSSGVAEAKVKPLREHSTPDSHITSRLDVLNKEIQEEKLELFTKKRSSELKKRSRMDSNLKTDKEPKSRLKVSKLSIPSHVDPNELMSKRPMVDENSSRSITNSPKVTDGRCLKVTERNFSVNDPGWHHLYAPAGHQSPVDGKHESRGSAPQVVDRQSAKVSNKDLTSQVSLQIQSSTRSQSIRLEQNDVRSLPHTVVDDRLLSKDDKNHSDSTWDQSLAVKNYFAIEENHDGIVGTLSSHGFHPKHSVEGTRCMQVEKQGTEDFSSLHQNGANVIHIDSEQDMKPSHGKVPREEDLPKSLRKGLLTNESKRNIEVVEPHEKLSGVCKFPSSSQRAGSSLEDSRHVRVGSSQKPSLKRLDSKLDVSTQKSNSLRKSDTQPTIQQTKAVPERLKLNKVRHVAKGKPTVSPNRRVDETTAPRHPQELVDSITKSLTIEQRLPEPGFHHSSVAPSDNRRELFEPKKKIFNFPWNASLRIALLQGKALLLENVDPGFSSSEIEAMLQELLQVSCDVRMIPPKNFTCYTSGQALVLFLTKNAAVESLRKFTENWLIWSKDERPVLASIAEAEAPRSRCIHGFFDAESFGSMSSSSMKKSAVATSHCSQPNTVEYEMGIQWRLLQDRHAEAWRIVAEEHNLVADHMVQKSKHGRK